MADCSAYSDRSGGDDREDASFDDFDAMRHAMLDCIAFGMPAEFIQPLLRRAENVRHAKVLFMLARDGFESDFLSGESARIARRISAAVRGEVFARDGRKCAYCGDTDGPFHIDHIKPVAAGGSRDIGNLAVACAACNLSKGAKPLSEWGGAK